MTVSLDLRRNTERVVAFRQSVNFCNIDHIPQLMREVLITEAWRQRYEAGHFFKFHRFVDFITTRPLAGCGWTPKHVEALLNQAKADQDTLRRWRQAITPPVGTNQYSEGASNRSTHHGTTRAYTLDRLERDYPELYQRVIDGSLSANAAALEAGFRKSSTRFEKILEWLPKLSDEERNRLREILDA